MSVARAATAGGGAPPGGRREKAPRRGLWVPSRWSPDGPTRMSVLVALGSCGTIARQKSASRIQKPRIAAPKRNVRERTTARPSSEARRPRVGGGVATAVAASTAALIASAPAGGCQERWSSDDARSRREADARVERGVEDVGNEVREHVQDGGEQHDGLDHRDVVRLHRVVGEAADAGIREQRL